MIRFKIKELIADKEFRENRRIRFNEIAETTGIHRVTLGFITNKKGYNVGVDYVDRLCRFFNCQPGDLMVYVDDPLRTRQRVSVGTKGKGSKVVKKRTRK